MRPDKTDELKAVVKLLRPALQRVVGALEASLADEGVGVPLRGCLEHLLVGGPKTVPELARELGLVRQFAQRIANEGVALGLLAVEPNPAHKRSVRYAPTAAGRAAFRRMDQRETRVVKHIAQSVSAADVAACRRVLLALIAGVGEGP